MYTVSENIRSLIKQGARSSEMIFDFHVYIDEIEYANKIRNASMELTWPYADTSMWSIGKVLSKKFSADFRTTDNLTGKTILYTVDVISDSETVNIPIFKGKITSSKTLDEETSITAYDCIYFLNEAYTSELTYPADISDVLSELKTMSGVSVETISLPTFSIEKPFEGYTYRQAFGKIAELIGANVSSSRTGKVQFFQKTATGVEYGTDMFYNLKFKDGQAINCISCSTLDGETLYSGVTNGIGPAISNINMTQDRLDIIIGAIYDPGYKGLDTCKIAGDPTLDLGDVLTFYDMSGNEHRIIVMGMKHSFTGGICTYIDCYTTSVAESEVKTTSLTQKFSSIAKDIDGVHINVRAINGQIGELNTQVEVLAGQVGVKVSKDELISFINICPESIKIRSDKIDLEGYVTITSLKDENSTTEIDGCNIKCKGSYNYTSMGETESTLYYSNMWLNSGRLKFDNGKTGDEYETLYYGWEGVSTGNDPNNSTGGLDLRSNIFQSFDGSDSYNGATVYSRYSPVALMSKGNAGIIAPQYYDTTANPNKNIFSFHIRDGKGCLDFGQRTANAETGLFNYDVGLTFKEGKIIVSNTGNGSETNLGEIIASNIPLPIVSVNINTDETLITATLSDGSTSQWNIATDETNGITFTKVTE